MAHAECQNHNSKNTYNYTRHKISYLCTADYHHTEYNGCNDYKTRKVGLEIEQKAYNAKYSYIRENSVINTGKFFLYLHFTNYKYCKSK